MIARLVLSGIAVAMLCVASTAYALARDPIDEEDMTAMRTHRPHAAELVEKGEVLAAVGSVEEAEGLFRQARTEYADAGLPWRRDCEALTVLGKRNEAAFEACTRAVENRRTNVNMRALVRSIVDGPSAPTTGGLFQALAITAFARKTGPTTTGAAMACDIAGRIGDGAMLERCAEELERLAPDDPETRKARALLQSRCPPLRFWGGWLAIAAAIAITIADAMRRRALGPRRGAAVVVATAVLCLLPRAALADEKAPAHGWLSKLPIDDDHPEKSIPSEKQRNDDPMEFGYWLQDIALKAEHASGKGDHAAAARYYVAMTIAVPDHAVGFVKMCKEYEDMGDRERAVSACGDALLRDGTLVRDYTHFVHLLLAKPGPLTDKETAALGQVLEHMKEDPASHDVVNDIECEIGVRTSNTAMLKDCTTAFAAASPDDAKTITYEWALAVQEGNFSQANKLIEQARTLGVPSSSVAEMQHATATNEKRHRIRVLLVTLGIALFLGAGVWAGRLLARRHLSPKAA